MSDTIDLTISVPLLRCARGCGATAIVRPVVLRHVATSVPGTPVATDSDGGLWLAQGLERRPAGWAAVLSSTPDAIFCPSCVDLITRGATTPTTVEKPRAAGVSNAPIFHKPSASAPIPAKPASLEPVRLAEVTRAAPPTSQPTPMVTRAATPGTTSAVREAAPMQAPSTAPSRVHVNAAAGVQVTRAVPNTPIVRYQPEHVRVTSTTSAKVLPPRVTSTPAPPTARLMPDAAAPLQSSVTVEENRATVRQDKLTIPSFAGGAPQT